MYHTSVHGTGGKITISSGNSQVQSSSSVNKQSPDAGHSGVLH